MVCAWLSVELDRQKKAAVKRIVALFIMMSFMPVSPFRMPVAKQDCL